MKKLKYLYLLLPFLFISPVKAATFGSYNFVGHKIDDEWSIASGSSITGYLSFTNSVDFLSTTGLQDPVNF